MEMESVTARIQMLEDDMLDLQGRMLELEQLIKEQRNTATITQPSRIVTNPNSYPSHTATSTVSSPVEHRSSQDDSTTSTWPRESSSDVASIASSRSSTDDFMDSTITLQHPKHDTNQHHLNQAQPDYAASPKLYKMFIESKTDMDSLQSAITKLRADAASSLRLSGSNSAASSRRSTSKGSPSLGRAELVKHLLLASDGALLAAIASTSTSSHETRRSEAATLRRPTTSHDTRRRDSETYQDAMSPSTKSTPQRAATTKRSSAIFWDGDEGEAGVGWAGGGG